jgi:nickel-dependent lactate racemase
MVVASSGGYPKDINFIQAHKSVHHAAAFVKDGGKLIVLSECIDGIGSDTFLKYLEPGSFAETFRMLKDNYEGNGGTALSLMTKTNRIKIYLYTSLEKSICDILNVVKLDESGIRSLIELHTGSLAVIENASLIIQ